MKKTRFTAEQKAFALRQADSGVPIGCLPLASRMTCRTMKYKPKASIAAAQTASTTCCPVGPNRTEPLKLAQARTVSQTRSQDQCTRAMSPKAQSPNVLRAVVIRARPTVAHQRRK